MTVMNGSSEVEQFETTLIERLRPYSKANNKSFTSSLAAVPWDEVAFDGYTAEQCQNKWTEILSRLRRFRTLQELLDDASHGHWVKKNNSNNIRKRLETLGCPPRPIGIYPKYMQTKWPEMKKSLPHGTAEECRKRINMEYASLHPDHMQRLRDEYKREYDDWIVKKQKFLDEHPEVSRPVAPLTALQLYAKRTNQPCDQALKQYMALSDEQRSKFTSKATKLQRKYSEHVEFYQKNVDPTWKPKCSNSSPSKSLFVPKPRSAFNIFRAEVWPSLSGKDLAEKTKQLSQKYRSASPSTLSRLKQQSIQEKHQYERFISTLPDDQRPPTCPSTGSIAALAKELFIEENRPDVSNNLLSSEEWSRLLTKKYRQLEKNQKEDYVKRAKTLRSAGVAEKLPAKPGQKSECSNAAVKTKAIGDHQSRDSTPSADFQVDCTARDSVTNGPLQASPSVSRSARRQKNKRSASAAELCSSDPVVPSPHSSSKLRKLDDDISSVVVNGSVLPPVPLDDENAGGVRREDSMLSPVPLVDGAVEVVKSESFVLSPAPLANGEDESADDNLLPFVDGGFDLFMEKYSAKLDSCLSDKKKRKEARRAWKEMSNEKRLRYIRKYKRRV